MDQLKFEQKIQNNSGIPDSKTLFKVRTNQRRPGTSLPFSKSSITSAVTEIHDFSA